MFISEVKKKLREKLNQIAIIVFKLNVECNKARVASANVIKSRLLLNTVFFKVWFD